MIKYTLLIIWLIYTLLFLVTHPYITPRFIKHLLELMGCCIEKNYLMLRWLCLSCGWRCEQEKNLKILCVNMK